MNKSIRPLFLVMIVSLAIALFWNQVPIIKESVGTALDPTAGRLLNWNASIGMTFVSAIISLFIIIVQKYTTDQETLREIKKEQKVLQTEMKKYRDQPEKFLEMQKKQFAMIPRTMDITLRPIMYTSIPIILLFRWFSDYFVLTEARVFGMSWILAYILFSLVFSSIFRKVFNVA